MTNIQTGVACLYLVTTQHDQVCFPLTKGLLSAQQPALYPGDQKSLLS